MATLPYNTRAEKPREKDKIKDVLLTINFGKEIIEVFSDPTAASTLPAGFSESLVYSIEHFPKAVPSTASQCHDDLDKVGTALWNQCTRLRRSFNSAELSPKTASTNILLVRIYALLLLDCAQSNKRRSAATITRLMRLVLKAVRNCIELKQYDLAAIALEKAGSYDEFLQKAVSQQSEEDEGSYIRLNAEYFALRTALACKQEKFSVAEHLFAKVEAGKQHLDIESAESIADVLYELAKRQLDEKQYITAIKWLDRALDLLMTLAVDDLSSDTSELRISILQSSVTALLKCQDPQAMDQVDRVIGMLESELGPKLVVLLLKLERLESPINEVFDGEGYALVLHKMVHAVDLNDNTFKTLMHHVRRLNDKNPSLACKILDELITVRLQDDQYADRRENVLINRLWMTTNQSEDPGAVMDIERLLETIYHKSGTCLSAAGTHAAQILLWKRVEQNYSTSCYEPAERWCRLALHKIFDIGTGDLNRGKIIRRLLMCALARLDIDSAQRTVAIMSEQIKGEMLTQFLLFKLAIRTDDLDQAQRCLTLVSLNLEEDVNLLYACVLDAQKAGCKKMAVAALLLVLDKSREQTTTSVHRPALLRCTIRIIISMLNVDDPSLSTEIVAAIDQLCRLFDLAASQVQKTSAKTDDRFDRKELDWFSKNSYNLALKYSTSWRLLQVYRLISASIIFCEAFPSDLEVQTRSDVQLRRVFSDYLASILLVTLARAQDNVETQLQHYLELRSHVADFDAKLLDMAVTWEGPLLEDLDKKLCALLAFDFEAAIKLRKWQDLGSIILKSEKCGNLWLLEVFADCLLGEQVPPEVLIVRLKEIVNSAWSIAGIDMPRFSRYLRLLFQVALIHNEPTAMELLVSSERYIGGAKDTDAPYPYEEIEWIATTAFNHAIDFYCREDDAKCKEWAGRAISIASLLNDSQALQDVLIEKLAKLSLS